jgi:hypothetical protein
MKIATQTVSETRTQPQKSEITPSQKLRIFVCQKLQISNAHQQQFSILRIVFAIKYFVFIKFLIFSLCFRQVFDGKKGVLTKRIVFEKCPLFI